jgi:ubiquinol-cytochrome c reductase cytochrome c1 subunit
MRKFAIVLLAALGFAGLAHAAGPAVQLQSAHANVSDRASLQRGAALFMNYCASCHSAQFNRYSRIAEDLGLTEAQVMESLNFTGAKFGEPVKVAMDPADATQWFGAAPPDLSLTARAKHGGADWIYTYLKSFYVDESRAIGWNNPVLPGASMPHVLWELQGVQRVVTEPKATDAGGKPMPCANGEVGGACLVKFELVTPGMLDEAGYDRAIRDITNFMVYMSEPAALQREAYGPWVILFLAFFTFIAWLLKREYWRDMH